VVRTKSGERAMIEATLSQESIMGGSMDGRFAFPRFQSAFDGMFAIGKMMELLAAHGAPLSEVLSDVPKRAFLQTSLPCVLEMKGGIMRKMSEDSLDKEASFVDGIKVNLGQEWVLLLPDQYLPVVNLVAEAKDQKTAQKLLGEYRKKVERWKKELQ
jgi:mannose-1-phosphate guanylyltransferase/phosphomannomutase